MALKIIVSYDDTDNDRDALALGKLLAGAGAELALAYVRHSYGESLPQEDAEGLLARGVESLGDADVPTHVVDNAATSVGLEELVASEAADAIVFGSEYRTATGIVKPGISAHRMLLGGPAAVAVAPAGFRESGASGLETIGVIDEGDQAARDTAESLAAAYGATVTNRPATRVDLLVVGSRPESPEGKVTLSAASDYAVEAATSPVVVLARGRALSFGAPPPPSPEPEAPEA